MAFKVVRLPLSQLRAGVDENDYPNSSISYLLNNFDTHYACQQGANVFSGFSNT